MNITPTTLHLFTMEPSTDWPANVWYQLPANTSWNASARMAVDELVGAGLLTMICTSVNYGVGQNITYYFTPEGKALYNLMKI